MIYGIPAAEFGPLVGGVGVFLGAVIALVTAILITHRHNNAQRHEWEQERRKRVADTFRQLHESLWKDAGVVKIRRSIVNDTEYQRDLLPVLVKRNATERNTLDREENNVIEDLDRYCGTMLRLETAMKDLPLTEREEKLWRKLLWRKWQQRIREDRPELYTYIERYWGEELLTDPAKPPRPQ